MAMVLVGAMIVAGIETVWDGQVAPPLKAPIHKNYTGQTPVDVNLEKGEEMGRFKLGSTVILLFGEDAITWVEDLKAESAVRLGENIASRACASRDEAGLAE